MSNSYSTYIIQDAAGEFLDETDFYDRAIDYARQINGRVLECVHMDPEEIADFTRKRSARSPQARTRA